MTSERLWLSALLAVVIVPYVPAVQRAIGGNSVFGIPAFLLLLLIQTGVVLTILSFVAVRAFRRR